MGNFPNCIKWSPSLDRALSGLLRFPERRLQKRYERIFILAMATWSLSVEAIYAATWPCWATPKEVAIWPWWLANCDLSEVVELAGYWGQTFFAAGLILLLMLRILRTRGLDRRIYVPVHIASIVGMAATAGLGVWSLAYLYGLALRPPPVGNMLDLLPVGTGPLSCRSGWWRDSVWHHT
jgi:hypothetical protein